MHKIVALYVTSLLSLRSSNSSYYSSIKTKHYNVLYLASYHRDFSIIDGLSYVQKQWKIMLDALLDFWGLYIFGN